MSQVQLINLSINDLKCIISDTFRDEQKKFSYVPYDPERLFTRKETKETFGVDYSTLHRWDKKDYLKPIKVGGLIRYKFSDIQKILNGGE